MSRDKKRLSEKGSITSKPTFTPNSIQTQPLATQVAPPIQSTASLSARDIIPPLGMVTGNLSFPSSFIPAMRVVFFSLTDGADIGWTISGAQITADLASPNWQGQTF